MYISIETSLIFTCNLFRCKEKIIKFYSKSKVLSKWFYVRFNQHHVALIKGLFDVEFFCKVFRLYLYACINMSLGSITLLSWNTSVVNIPYIIGIVVLEVSDKCLTLAVIKWFRFFKRSLWRELEFFKEGMLLFLFQISKIIAEFISLKYF